MNNMVHPVIRKYVKALFLIVSLLLNSVHFPASAEQSAFDYSSFLELHGADLLRNWHLPQGEELSYWGTNRNTFFYKSTENEGKYKEPWWTKGDFNSDGFVDVSFLLFKNSENKANLFAFLSKHKESYLIHDVHLANKLMGIRTLKAQKGDHVVDALKLFEFEGHAIIYIWNSHYDKFIEIPDGYSLEHY